MSFHVFRSQWLEAIAEDLELPDSVSRIAIVLAKHFNSQTEEAWPSAARLADMTGNTVRTVQRALKMLQDRGYLRVSTGRGRGNTNSYIPLRKGRAHEDRAEKIRHQSRIYGERKYDSGAAENTTLLSHKPIEGTNPQKAPACAVAKDDSAEPDFDAFEALWKWADGENRETARRAFRRIVAADRALAIASAPAYLRDCAARGRRPMRASRWLGGKCYSKGVMASPPVRCAAEPTRTDRGYFVKMSSPPFAAWRTEEGPANDIVQHMGVVGIWRATVWPPGREPALAGDGAAR